MVGWCLRPGGHHRRGRPPDRPLRDVEPLLRPGPRGDPVARQRRHRLPHPRVGHHHPRVVRAGPRPHLPGPRQRRHPRRQPGHPRVPPPGLDRGVRAAGPPLLLQRLQRRLADRGRRPPRPPHLPSEPEHRASPPGGREGRQRGRPGRRPCPGPDPHRPAGTPPPGHNVDQRWAATAPERLAWAAQLQERIDTYRVVAGG